MLETQGAPASVTGSATADPSLLQDQLAIKQDDYLRLAADFDNFRKRTRRDSAQQAAAEKDSFILELLPIIDNLGRAVACDGANSSEQLHQGVAMTVRQLDELLRRHGIETFEAAGQPFDPHWHEAVAVGHDPSQAEHVVLEVIQRGYARDGKMFRPARVIVNDPRHSPGAGRGR